MTYQEAWRSYGSDRPDLRYSPADPGLDRRRWGIWTSGGPAAPSKPGGGSGASVLEGGASLSRKEIEGLEGLAKKAGAPGLLWVKRSEEGGSGPLARFMAEEHFGALVWRWETWPWWRPGPTGSPRRPWTPFESRPSGALGVEPGRRRTPGSGLWTSRSSRRRRAGPRPPPTTPSCIPHPETLDLLEDGAPGPEGQAYDLVFNGVEFGSGSIRNHRPEIQRVILRHLGLSDEEIDRKFGFLLEALTLGAPPHGGIALGMDRIVKEFIGAPSLRDVIAFPKTTAARALLEGAPTPLSDEELLELHLRRLPEEPGPDHIPPTEALAS